MVEKKIELGCRGINNLEGHEVSQRKGEEFQAGKLGLDRHREVLNQIGL